MLHAQVLGPESPGSNPDLWQVLKEVTGFPGGSDGKESACNARNLSLLPGFKRSSGKGNGDPLQYSCLENPRDGGAWWASVYGVAQSQTRLKRPSSNSSSTSLVAQMVKRLSRMWETRVQSLGREDPLEKEMAIHSRTIAWKIPWTEEPGRLQSMGWQRVGHD